MTEDSQNRVRGSGPFDEGAEPTKQIAVPKAGAAPADAQPSDPAQPSVPAPEEPYPAFPPDVFASGSPPPSSSPGSDLAGGATFFRPDATPPAGAHPTSGVPASNADPASAAPADSGPASAPPANDGLTSSSPVSSSPVSGGSPVAPTSADPYYGYSGADPVSGSPYAAAPTSGSAYAAAPTSGSAYGHAPFYTGTTDRWSPAGQTSGASTPPTPETDSFGLPPAALTGRRIEPSPPPPRSRLLTGLLAGLVAGLLLFGTTGWFAGRATAPEPSKPTTTPTAAAPKSTLGVFEQSQAAINQPDFDGTPLTGLAQGWLPYLSTCGRSGKPGGPTLDAGEKTRVRCTLDGMSALFVEYNSIADRDKARVVTLGQNVDARTLTPGVGEPGERPTPSGRTTGNYVEYSFELTEDGVTRTVAGVWWDDAQTPIAAYLLAYWKDGVGEHWEPVRDLWSRYA
ncbi:hypothetical protein [Paractinoplanes durhamensis]|uniref:hypothetical protein n=1 Tax=Paractinoplanes durhamensis TaxID=113563 RepID=UPI001942D420|nr:hypothetical protein [Actinoplanes durhamensis]